MIWQELLVGGLQLFLAGMSTFQYLTYIPSPQTKHIKWMFLIQAVINFGAGIFMVLKNVI